MEVKQRVDMFRCKVLNRVNNKAESEMKTIAVFYESLIFLNSLT